ncbi:MAG: hypothetical protein R3D33_18200 [Hyphomicrobiaceae bacterium]
MATKLERVDRIRHILDIAGHGLAVAVGQEGRDLALMHPRHGVDVEPGLALAGGLIVPRAEGKSAGMVAGTKDEDIAFAEPHASAFSIARSRRASPLRRARAIDAAMARGVEQDAAADDAVGIGGDAAPVRAARCQRGGGLAVVEQAL